MARAVETIPETSKDRDLDLSQYDILGHRITSCRIEDVRSLIGKAVSGALPPQRLSTVNLNFCRLAEEQPGFARTLASFEHRFADGWPLLHWARMLGTPIPERVTGSDLTSLICDWAAEESWRIGFVGAGEDVREQLRSKHHHLYGPVVVGHWVPHYPGQNVRDSKLAATIRNERVDVLLVALGCPKQEFWIRENFTATGARVALGVGGSLDMLAGVVHRAPRLLQRLRLEFLYRFLQEPRRLGGRYLRDFKFYRRARRRVLQGNNGRVAKRLKSDP